MNHKIYLLQIVLCLLLADKLMAQPKLGIEISAANSPTLIVKLNGGVPIPNEGELEILADNWSLKIDNKNAKKFSVVLKNNEEEGTVTLTDFSKTYFVENNVLKGTSFTFSGSFNILLRDNNNTDKVIHTIKYTVDVEPDKNAGDASGSAIYDAFYLRSKNGDPLKKLKILAYYADIPASLDTVKKVYINNKFLKKEALALTLRAAHGSASFPGLSSALASVGGLDVTNIADGLAKFLVKRTKEELNVTFFQHFRDFLNKPEYKDLHTLFPETHRTFDIIGNEIYNYERYIQTLRESFRHDLANLTTNLPTIIENHPHFFTKYPELEATLTSGVYIAEGLRDKIHPGDILGEYPTTYLDSLRPEWKGGLQTLQLFSESLRDSARSDSAYWVSAVDLKKTVKDTAVFRIYIGLTYQMAKSKFDSIPFTPNTSLVSIMDKTDPGKLQAHQNYVFRFIGKTDKLNQLIQNYARPANDSLALEQYYNYFKASVDLLEYTTEAAKLPFVPEEVARLKESMKDYFDVANSTADLVLDINRKNYSSAVINAVHIYEVIKVRGSKAHEKELRDGIMNLTTRISSPANASSKLQLETMLVDLKAELNREIVSKKVMAKLFTYGSFMSSIVMAESSDEVAEAIEAFALPTGSARIKRETCFNVALNAYLGPYLGTERIHDVDQSGQGTFGLTAPIGVSISKGHFPGKSTRWEEGKGGWSTSLFISFIDIGALASYRFTENTTTPTSTDTVTVNQVSKIELKNILSPGAFLSIGIPRSPLSINAGVQVGPNLRSVRASPGSTSTDNTYEDKMYVRCSIALVVDIPILNFYTKSKD